MADIMSTLAERSHGMPWYELLLCFGTVFLGLVCIVILCSIVGAFCKGSAEKEDKKEEIQAKEETAAPENRQEIIAAVTAVCAEEMGKDIKALRVVSFKKL